jgi:TP901 family phage tail tape measure protein
VATALVWDLIARDGASAGFAKAGTAAERAGIQTETASKKINGMGTSLLGVGLVLGAGEMVKSAVKFQSNMLLLQTQAGQSSESVKEMSKSVLGLAGATGTAPDELATSLYHVVSTGLRGAQALDAVKIAAEGAKVGHADLEATTNALTAAIASGIPGVQNMSSAMGSLNAIVGAGDMKMQDLNEAMGSGVLTVVKGYGLSLNDVGAALATFGDNNIRGADAATMLRMAVQAMSKPAKEGTQALKDMGLSTSQLRDDMSRGGLNLALTDLVAHLHASGIGAEQVGGILTEVFGKKAGPGIAVLVSQFDRFETKTKEVAAGGKTFGEAWNTWLKSNQGQMDLLRGKTEAVGIEVGNKLLPILNSTVGFVNDNSTALLAMGAGLVGVKVAITGVKVATELWSAATVAVRAVIAGTETAYIASMYAMEAAQTRFNAAVAGSSIATSSFIVGAAGAARAWGPVGLLAAGIIDQNKQLATSPKGWWAERNPFHLENWMPFHKNVAQAKQETTGLTQANNFMTDSTLNNAKALVAATSATKDNNAVTPQMAQLVAQAKAAIAAEAFAAQDLSSQLKGLNSQTLDVKDTQLAFLDSIQSLTDGIKQNGKSLTDNTAEGRKNEEGLLSAIKAAQAHAVAVQASGKSAVVAAAAYASDEKALIKAAIAAGFSKDQVNKLIKTYGGVPKEVSTNVIANTVPAHSKMSVLDKRLNQYDRATFTSTVSVNTGAAMSALQAFANEANAAQAAAQIVGSVTQSVQHAPGHASGGYLNAGWNRVNEQGGEMIYNAAGGNMRVLSASDTNRTRTTGQGMTVNLYVTQPLGTPTQIAAAVVPALRMAFNNGMSRP